MSRKGNKMTQCEKRKIILELLNQKPGLDIPKLFVALNEPEMAVRDELKTLKQSNDRLRGQLASLQSRNDELETYAQTVSHDLKNPLAIIIAYCDTIRFVGDLTSKELQELLQQITSTSYEMNAIIDNLLLLSEVRKVDKLTGSLEMAMVMANVQKRLSKMIKEYDGHITFPRAWPAALGYAPWIEEVWVNYISNALKYGGQSPWVKLGAETQPDGMVRFWIRDNGPGLTPESQARLFSPFTQLGKVHKSGHGLGLSIVRQIVEKQGGQVGVESQSGKGCLFFFTLPSSHLMPEAVSGHVDSRSRRKARPVRELDSISA
jgi:two-component system sensor histidine kinase/response regulator